MDDTNQQDISGSLGMQLTDNWSIRGRMRYDIDDEFVLSDAIQLRYADECFILTATYSESYYNDPTRDIDTDRTLFLRFQLKHIGNFEYKTDALDYVMGDQRPPHSP
jgi:LPS-assembly protein